MCRSNFIADQTIPGLCSSDLASRAVDAVLLQHRRVTGRDLHRQRYAFREALKDLDSHLLRDIGIDLRGV